MKYKFSPQQDHIINTLFNTVSTAKLSVLMGISKKQIVIRAKELKVWGQKLLII